MEDGGPGVPRSALSHLFDKFYRVTQRGDGSRPGSGIGPDQFPDVEVVIGTPAGDTLLGDTTDNLLRGRGGDDHLEGRGGDDILEGLSGLDFLDGGDGNDRLDGGSGTDECVNGEIVLYCDP